MSASKYICETAPRLPLQCVYDGFDSHLFFPQKNTLLQRELNLPLSSYLIVLVGFLARWKGQIEFIKAAHEIIKTEPRARFAIVGSKIYDTKADTDYEDEIKSLIQKLHLQNFVFIVPFKKNSAEVFNSAHLIAHCSIQPEPFGRVIVEAQLCRIPVVATQAGGVLEIIDNHQTGLLYEPGNIKELVQAVLQTMSNTEIDAQLDAAEKRVQLLFDSERQYQEQKKWICRNSN